MNIYFPQIYTREQVTNFINYPFLLFNEPPQPNRNIINMNLDSNVLSNNENLKYINYTKNNYQICTEVFEKIDNVWRRRINQK